MESISVFYKTEIWSSFSSLENTDNSTRKSTQEVTKRKRSVFQIAMEKEIYKRLFLQT